MKNCLICGNEYARPKKQGFKWFEKSKFCSRSCADKSKIGQERPVRTKEWSDNLSKSLKGRKTWNKDKKCPSISNALLKSTYQRKGLAGEKNPMFGKVGKLNPAWKGGVTTVNMKARNSGEYNIWRVSVFKRDNYTCQLCGDRCVKLNAHHIQLFSTHIDLRFILSNGITLCVDCHNRTKKRESNYIPRFTRINMFKHCVI